MPAPKHAFLAAGVSACATGALMLAPLRRVDKTDGRRRRVEGIGVLAVNVRGGYLFARCVRRLGDRDCLARYEDADLVLLVPEDRLPADDWDDHLRVQG